MAQEIATLAGGCFWCTEAVFQDVVGVSRVVSGYIGGQLKNPTYEQVCSGRTGHAEAVQVTFDPEVISYRDILGIFFATHDPTTLNRQGGDVGTQYRSSVFYHSEEQRRAAQELIAELDAQHIWDRPIVTGLEEATTFYPAENYHQDFFKRNPSQPYCVAVVAPKVIKFRKQFSHLLRSA